MTQRTDLHDWLRLLRSDGHLLHADPGPLFQQAANQPEPTAPARAALARWHAGRVGRPWIRWISFTAAAAAAPKAEGFR